MNERVAAVGDQLKNAFGRVREFWQNLAPLRKRIIIIAGIAILALAVGIAIFSNARASRYVVLYENMTSDEATRALAVLQENSVDGRINEAGQLEVKANNENRAMGLLAVQGIPNSTLGYDVFAQAAGLTTTDFEKKQYQVNQTQNRLQDIIKTYDGVENAYVTLNIEENSSRVWNAGASPNTASVKVVMGPGQVLTTGQVSGIRYLVGASAGINPEEVAVMDDAGVTLAASGEGYDAQLAATSSFLQRQGFQEEVEKKLADKTENILSLPYPDAAEYRISVTAQLDWDAMITESMEYTPMEGTDHGIMDHEDLNTTMGTGQYAEGIVGETDNTDIPTYADLDGDGEMDIVDYRHNRDYLVSYVKQQIEKDGATLAEASIGVMIRGTLNNDTRQTLRELIATATNLPIENVNVQGMLDTPAQTEDLTQGDTIFGLPALFIYIAAGVLAVMVILLVVILIMRNRAKKKRLALALAEAEAEEAETLRVQAEIEERKKQLKNAAIADNSDNAITEEVREFARANPEITANLLRNWLKEGE